MKKAIAIYEEVLKLRTSTLGPDHPRTLAIRQDLATAYQATGRTNEAMAIYEEVLTLQTSKLGPAHPDTLCTRQNLASAYQATGRTKEAIAIFEDVLNSTNVDARPRLPRHTRYRRRSRRGLRCRRAVRQVRAALPRQARPLQEAIWSASLADEPAMANLGMNLLAQKKSAEAEPLLRGCLAIREKATPDHWATFNARSLLGASLLGQKKYAEAEPLVLCGYEGMKAREAQIGQQVKWKLPEAGERVVQLYEAWGKPEQVAAWRAKLGLSSRELPSDVFAR